MNAPIYLDATPLTERRLTGIGRMVAQLACRLAQKREIRLFCRSRYIDLVGLTPHCAFHAGLEIVLNPSCVPPSGEDMQQWRERVLALAKQPFDRELASRSTGIYTFLRPGHRVFARELTVHHDFTPVLLPKTHTSGTRSLFTPLCEDNALLDDHCISNSHATAHDLSWLAGVTPNRIAPLLLGPSLCVEDHLWPTIPDRDESLLVAVSTLEPRKNPQFLLEWFLESKALPECMTLAWAGPAGWNLDQGTLPVSRGKRHIRFLGMIEDIELCRLYRQARAVIYPSLYEGFGLPVLDALLHGTPVLCSGNSSLMEFAGPGVEFFDPCDSSSVDEAWDRLYLQNLPISRPDLAVACSWDTFTDGLLAVVA